MKFYTLLIVVCFLFFASCGAFRGNNCGISEATDILNIHNSKHHKMVLAKSLDSDIKEDIRVTKGS